MTPEQRQRLTEEIEKAMATRMPHMYDGKLPRWVTQYLFPVVAYTVAELKIAIDSVENTARLERDVLRRELADLRIMVEHSEKEK